MFPVIFQRFFNFFNETKAEVPNLDYVLHYENNSGANPELLKAKLNELHSTKKDNKERVQSALKETMEWLGSAQSAKPHTRVYAREEMLPCFPDQAPKRVIVLYQKELSSFSIFAFIQSLFLRSDESLAKKVVSDLYEGTKNHSITKNVDGCVPQFLQMKNLNVLASPKEALEVGDLRTAVSFYVKSEPTATMAISDGVANPFSSRGLGETIGENNADSRNDHGEISEPTRDIASGNPTGNTVECLGNRALENMPATVNGELDLRSQTKDFEKQGNSSGESEALGALNPFSVGNAGNDGDQLIDIASKSADQVCKETIHAKEEKEDVEEKKINTEKRKPERRENEFEKNTPEKRSKKIKAVKIAVIENPDDSCAATSRKHAITIGELILPEDWRKAEMLVMSHASRGLVHVDILEDFNNALPSQLFKKIKDPCIGGEIKRSERNEKPCLFVPVADMLDVSPTDALPVVDVLWEQISVLAAQRQVRNLVVVPSYPLDADEGRDKMLAKTMIKAIRSSLGKDKKMEIRIVARSAAERQALEEVLAAQFQPATIS